MLFSKFIVDILGCARRNCHLHIVESTCIVLKIDDFLDVFLQSFSKVVMIQRLNLCSYVPHSPHISKFLKFGEAFLVARKEKPRDHYYMVQLHENHIYIAKTRIQNGDQLLISWISFHPLMKEIGIRIGVSRFESQTLIGFTPRLPLIFSIFYRSLAQVDGEADSTSFFFKGRVFFWGEVAIFSVDG